MNSSMDRPRIGETTWIWFAKIFSGLVILIILFLHFVVNHLAAPQGLLTYADIVAYYQNPLIPPMEIIFLIFVVTHALLGLRGIILDLKPAQTVLRVINWTFPAIGLAAIAYGIWLILVIVSRGAVS